MKFRLLLSAVFLFLFWSGNVLSQGKDRANIPGIPIPLKWGMTKQEILEVIKSKDLHLAFTDKKTLSKRKYHKGLYYEWAAIKENQKFLGNLLFIIGLNETDELIYLRAELNESDPKEHIGFNMAVKEMLGDSYKEIKNGRSKSIY